MISDRFEVLVLDEPLNFWAGLDVRTGEIIDSAHPQHGSSVTNRILVLPPGEGSSSNTSVIVETVHLKTAPAAVVTLAPDPVVQVAAAVAEELYGETLPTFIVNEEACRGLRSGESHSLRDLETLARSN